MNLGRYKEAIDLLETYVSANPRSTDAWSDLTVCYVATNRMDEAQKSAAELRKLWPKASIDYLKKLHRDSVDKDTVNFVIECYRKVGIPEHPPS